jgi:CBS domain-containing protein
MFRTSVRIRDYMIRRPVLVRPDSDIFDAIRQIINHRISGVIVVDEHRTPVGILSELDCLRAILSGSYYGEEQGVVRVEDYMTSPVETIHVDENIIDVAKSMLDHKRRRRPVVDENGHLIGQVTCRALLKAIRDLDIPDHKPT